MDLHQVNCKVIRQDGEHRRLITQRYPGSRQREVLRTNQVPGINDATDIRQHQGLKAWSLPQAEIM